MTTTTRWTTAVFPETGILAQHEAEDMARRLFEEGIESTVVAWDGGWLCTVCRDDLDKAETALRNRNF